MIICSCFGTTDREIRASFGPGGDRRCPAGQGCGGCQPMVEAIAAECGEQPAQPAPQGGSHRDAPRTAKP